MGSDCGGDVWCKVLSGDSPSDDDGDLDVGNEEDGSFSLLRFLFESAAFLDNDVDDDGDGEDDDDDDALCLCPVIWFCGLGESLMSSLKSSSRRSSSSLDWVLRLFSSSSLKRRKDVVKGARPVQDDVEPPIPSRYKMLNGKPRKERGKKYFFVGNSLE